MSDLPHGAQAYSWHLDFERSWLKRKLSPESSSGETSSHDSSQAAQGVPEYSDYELPWLKRKSSLDSSSKQSSSSKSSSKSTSKSSSKSSSESSDKALGIPPYSAYEKGELKQLYGGEFKFLRIHGLSIHYEDERQEGRRRFRSEQEARRIFRPDWHGY